MLADNKNEIVAFYKHHLLLFLKFAALLALIGLFERVVFAVYHNHLSASYSGGDIAYAIFWGLRFDFALAGFFGLLTLMTGYLLRRLLSIPQATTLKYFAFLAGSIIFIVQGADIIYFFDAARHIGYEITDTFNDAPHLLATAWTQYKAPFIFHLLLYPLLLYIIYRLFGRANPDHTPLSGFKKLHLESVYILLILFAVILTRGGLQSIPLEPLHAQEISDPVKASLALNGAYNAIFYLFSSHIVHRVPVNAAPSLDVENTVEDLYRTTSLNSNGGDAWTPNIIFIFLESWPAMYMQSYGYEKATTPFFDKLRQQSLTSREMIAGGHRTTEGMFAALCSAQNPLGQTVARSQLQDFEYRCLPQMLRDKGYSTAFFQGSNRNTSGTGAFAQLLGFSESYGRADIEQRRYEENSWGVYDQDLYDYVYATLKSSTEPVFFGINTNTTHDIKVPHGVTPQFTLGKSDPSDLNALYFADRALEEFFNKLGNDPDVGDILWVIFADHTAGLRSSRFNNYRIPFLIYNKHKITPRLVDRVASQRDIAPTVLDMMNLAIPRHFAGKTLLRSDDKPYFADYYHGGVLGWIEDGYLLEVPVANPDNLSCYNVAVDKLQKNPIPCPGTAKKNRNRAVAFVKKMQSQLFNGKTTNRIY
ncbi:MAG: sulfatase-like hydrolase/transferase [Gammaproteobacteria bacterium]|jgi:phosphoglycerol transferase MdoB-like AlkP superfamily enzyme